MHLSGISRVKRSNRAALLRPPRRQYTFFSSNCSFFTRFGCAGDFTSYLGLNKRSAWTNVNVDPAGVPDSSTLGVPFVWITWDCSWNGPFICEWDTAAAPPAAQLVLASWINASHALGKHQVGQGCGC
jgi:hypothetical protein